MKNAIRFLTPVRIVEKIFAFSVMLKGLTHALSVEVLEQKETRNEEANHMPFVSN